MSALNIEDFQRALALACDWHRCHDPGALRMRIVKGVAKLVGGEMVTFEHFAPTIPEFWSVSHSGDPYPEWVWQAVAECQPEHPVISHYLQTGDLRAGKISDFVTQREWHRTGFYRRVNEPLGVEDQLGVCLEPPDAEFYAVVVNRGARNFTDREREMLTLLQPHMRQAYANAREFERLQRQVHWQAQAGEWVTQSAVLLDPVGRAVHVPARARRWMQRYFGRAGRGERLPSAVLDWLGRISSGAGDGVAPSPLVREFDGRRLVLRLRRGDTDEDEGAAIVLEEQFGIEPGSNRVLNLTARQSEVLLEAAKGKSNHEIAGVLFISPHTVKKHLENIYETLNVSGRCEAVSRLFEAGEA